MLHERSYMAEGPDGDRTDNPAMVTLTAEHRAVIYRGLFEELHAAREFQPGYDGCYADLKRDLDRLRDAADVLDDIGWSKDDLRELVTVARTPALTRVLAAVRDAVNVDIVALRDEEPEHGSNAELIYAQLEVRDVCEAVLGTGDCSALVDEIEAYLGRGVEA